MTQCSRPSSMAMRGLRLLALSGVLASLPAACLRVTPIVAPASLEGACVRFFEDLDAMIAEASVRDAGSVRVVGAPYLRTNRFLASFAQDGLMGEAFAAWLERMRAADAAARKVELSRLRSDEAARMPVSPFPAWLMEQSVAECGRRLVARDLASPERRAWLTEHIAVPDTYRPWYRAAGLYPLTRLVFDDRVAALHRELRRPFSLSPDKIPRQGRLVRYGPEPAASLGTEAVSGLLTAAPDNALMVPDPDSRALVRLFDTFAPVWEVDTLSTDDRIGGIEWGRTGQPEVAMGRPVVYRFTSHTRFRDRKLLQLNYLVWFPRRTAEHALDIYAGWLDGLIWRVTLAAEGRPLAYDTIHPCGCYYLLFPGLGYRVVQPSDGSESILSPYPLMAPKQGQRLVIRVSAGRHQVQAVYRDTDAGSGVRHGWREYEELLALPHPDGSRRSLFDEQGLVAGSERLERFLLWPSGVANPGAMRQFGTHAVALIGRRHFDDAHLLERLLLKL